MRLTLDRKCAYRAGVMLTVSEKYSCNRKAAVMQQQPLSRLVPPTLPRKS